MTRSPMARLPNKKEATKGLLPSSEHKRRARRVGNDARTNNGLRSRYQNTHWINVPFNIHNGWFNHQAIERVASLLYRARLEM